MSLSASSHRVRGSSAPLGVEHDPTSLPLRRQRLIWLLAARLAIATLLLGATLWVQWDASLGLGSFTVRMLLALIGMTYGASMIAGFWLRWGKSSQTVALTQLGWDLLLTSGLVYLTGGVASAFTFLYGVTVLMTAIVTGPRFARACGGIAVVLYLTVSIGLVMGWLPAPPDQRAELIRRSVSDFTYAALVNVLGLLLVTLLADNLASRLRSTGGQLRLATASARQLARLNEDILRSLSSGLVTTDLEGRVQTANPAAADILHHEPRALVGRPIDTLLPVDPCEPFPRTGGPDGVVRSEGTAQRVDGTHFPVGYSLSRLVNSEGAAIGYLFVFQDLTEVVQLRDAAERAERLATLGRLAAGLAHEIRNPLGSISGSVELIRESSHIDEEERRLLGIVASEADRLNELVTTMLRVGRPVELQRMRQDLGQLAQEVVEMARRGQTSSGPPIELSLPAEPVEAWIDPGHVRQVLWNLLKNALQASPRNATVEVSVLVTDGGSVIQVRDHGAGVDEPQQERIFDMFYSGRTHGVGLGLALVKQIVDAHDGEVSVRNANDGGAIFEAHFPPADQAKRGTQRSA